jgi:hypothetical protein
MAIPGNLDNWSIVYDMTRNEMSKFSKWQ